MAEASPTERAAESELLAADGFEIAMRGGNPV
jgi:hypothetical protein